MLTKQYDFVKKKNKKVPFRRAGVVLTGVSSSFQQKFVKNPPAASP